MVKISELSPEQQEEVLQHQDAIKEIVEKGSFKRASRKLRTYCAQVTKDKLPEAEKKSGLADLMKSLIKDLQ